MIKLEDGTIVYKTETILKDLDKKINMKKPFSLIRLGDGGIKVFHSVLFNDSKQIKEISVKEGIPQDKFVEVLNLWSKYLRRADYIDTCQVYFSKKFWPRLKSEHSKASRKTMDRLKMWSQLYYNFDVENVNYCNPEINYLSCLSDLDFNLIDVLKGRNICIISTFSKQRINKDLFNFCSNIDVIQIVGQYNQHYKKCFSETCEKLKNEANNYDLFLVAGGELGRIYSGIIKENNGRAFDIGFMMDYWCKRKPIHRRLTNYIRNDENNQLQIKLTPKGRYYRDYI